MSSSERPLVRGPASAIDPPATTMAPAMNAKTPDTPKRPSRKPMTRLVKIALNRLHE